MNVKAYLEIAMVIDSENPPATAKVYTDYCQPLLDKIEGVFTKKFLICDEDAQVLYGFNSIENAKAYLENDIFMTKVSAGLQPT